MSSACSVPETGTVIFGHASFLQTHSALTIEHDNMAGSMTKIQAVNFSPGFTLDNEVRLVDNIK